MTGRLYQLFSKFPGVRTGLQRTKRYMLLYYPQNEEKAMKEAVILYTKIIGIYLTGIIYVCVTRSFSFVGVFQLICMLIMAGRYVLLKRVARIERMLLEGVEKFIGELRFQYSYSRRLEEALEETINRQDGMMYLHSRELFGVLEEDEIQEEYIKKSPNRFLTLLYVLCKSIYEYGDREVEGESVCLFGLGIIKEGIQTELIKKKKTEHLFSGLLFTCMIPLVFTKVIEIWAISNMKELEVYYQGSYGMITTVLLCVITILCYSLIQHWQYHLEVEPIERKWLVRFAKVPIINRILSWQINRNYRKSLDKHRRLRECGVRENLKQYLLLQYITGLVASFIIIIGLFQYKTVSIKYPKPLQQAVVEESVEEKEVWTKWKYPWFIVFLPMAGGVGAYFLRYYILLIKRHYSGLKREEEILVFQSVILFLMHMEQISGDEIMQWLDKLAVYFKDSINQALYRLVYQDYEEAEAILETEDYMPMVMILEGIMACDQLSVEEAFLQMESDYHYMEEKYRQESEMYIEDQGAIGKVLAFLPLYMTVGLKLVVPFVLEGLSQLSDYSDNLKQFM